MLAKLQIYAAMFRRTHFTVAEIVGSTAASESAVQSVVRRMKPEWRTRTRLVSGRPGGSAFQYSLTDAGRQGIADELGGALRSVHEPAMTQSEQEPMGLAAARGMLATLREESRPEARESLCSQALLSLDWARREVDGGGYRPALREQIDGLTSVFRNVVLAATDRTATAIGMTPVTEHGQGFQQCAVLAPLGHGVELDEWMFAAGQALMAATRPAALNLVVLSAESASTVFVNAQRHLTTGAHVFFTFDSAADQVSSCIGRVRQIDRTLLVHCTFLDYSHNIELSKIVRRLGQTYYADLRSKDVRAVVSDVIREKFRSRSDYACEHPVPWHATPSIVRSHSDAVAYPRLTGPAV